MPNRNTMPRPPAAENRSAAASAATHRIAEPALDHRRARRVDPFVAVVAVQKRDRLLHVARRAGGERGVDEVVRTLRADARVLVPRVGDRPRARAAGCASRGCTPRRDRRPRCATTSGSNKLPSTGVAPSERASAALAGDRTSAVTSCPAASQRAHRPPTEHSCRSGNEDSHRNLLLRTVSSSRSFLIRILTIRDRFGESGTAKSGTGTRETGQNGAMTEPAQTPEPPYFAVIFTLAPRRAARRRVHRDRRATCSSSRGSSPASSATTPPRPTGSASPSRTGRARMRSRRGRRSPSTAPRSSEGRARWFDSYDRARRARRPRVRVHEAGVTKTDARPRQIKLGDDLMLAPAARQRRAQRSRASVRESLEHLKPWMPWADEESTRETFQRQRLRGARHKASIGDEWQYGLFPTDESSRDRRVRLDGAQVAGDDRDRILGARRRDRPRLRARARAARSPTRRSRSTASPRSASVATRRTRAARRCPAGLGFTLAGTETRPPQAPAESGQLMIWERTEPLDDPS